jgi:AcrR family transcriptional regulator
LAIDRRVMRTRTTLYDALVEFIRERDYDSIRIQDILQRANIGRSTFYAHFKSKDELLERSLERLRRELAAVIEGAPGASMSDVTRALFLHIDRYRDIHFALARSKAGALVHEALAANFTQVVRSLLTNGHNARMPRELAVAHIGNTLLTVLRWWLDRNPNASAGQADELFQRLVFDGVGKEWKNAMRQRGDAKGTPRA